MDEELTKSILKSLKTTEEMLADLVHEFIAASPKSRTAFALQAPLDEMLAVRTERLALQAAWEEIHVSP